jgi:hypothetical protein
MKSTAWSAGRRHPGANDRRRQDDPPPPKLAVNYETVLTWPQFDAWLAKIEAAELTALDTETTSLDPSRRASSAFRCR